MIFNKLVLLFIVSYFYWIQTEEIKTTADLAQNDGYSAETHTVITEDGYILQVYRILPKQSRNVSCVVLLLHDLFCSSDDYILTGDPLPIGYLMSQGGCDVWLGNTRGNKYSMGHIKYNASIDMQYWNFSLTENGIYDIPAMTDYILNVTNAEQITYMGHGYGATIFFIATSMLPEYNQKFHAMYAFAPIAFLGNIPTQLFKIIASIVMNNVTDLDEYSSTPYIVNDDILEIFGRTQCLIDTNNSPVCNNLYFLLAGYDLTHIYQSDIPKILSRSVTICATNQLFHFGQLIVSNRFSQYNYGPDYDLTKITTQITVYYTQDDNFVSKTDLDLLTSKLQNLQNVVMIECNNYTHVDFIYGSNQTTCAKKEGSYLSFSF